MSHPYQSSPKPNTELVNPARRTVCERRALQTSSCNQGNNAWGRNVCRGGRARAARVPAIGKAKGDVEEGT